MEGQEATLLTASVLDIEYMAACASVNGIGIGGEGGVGLKKMIGYEGAVESREMLVTVGKVPMSGIEEDVMVLTEVAKEGTDMSVVDATIVIVLYEVGWKW